VALKKELGLINIDFFIEMKKWRTLMKTSKGENQQQTSVNRTRFTFENQNENGICVKKRVIYEGNET